MKNKKLKISFLLASLIFLSTASYAGDVRISARDTLKTLEKNISNSYDSFSQFSEWWCDFIEQGISYGDTLVDVIRGDKP